MCIYIARHDRTVDIQYLKDILCFFVLSKLQTPSSFTFLYSNCTGVIVSNFTSNIGNVVNKSTRQVSALEESCTDYSLEEVFESSGLQYMLSCSLYMSDMSTLKQFDSQKSGVSQGLVCQINKINIKPHKGYMTLIMNRNPLK